jgi:hypothetical protein
MNLSTILKNTKITRTIATASIMLNISGCYTVFGPVSPRPSHPIEPSTYCMQRDMPASWKRQPFKGYPVMFLGPNSQFSSCYYQTDNEVGGYFEVDTEGLVWATNSNGSRITRPPYNLQQVFAKPSEIYTASVRFNQKQRIRR